METENIVRLGGGVVVAILVYVYLAFSTLSPTETGIDFNQITYTLGGRKEPGRRWLGIGHRFIKFPINVQTFEFIGHDSDFKVGDLIRSRTKDGLEVQLEVSLQYQLDKTRIEEIYARFGEDYQEVFVRLVMDTLNLESTKVPAFTFFSSRSKVEIDFADALQEVFVKEALCEVQGFQLRSVALPNLFEDSIQLTEVQKQDIKMAEAEVEWKTIEAQTKVLEATQFANATVTAAEATSETIRLNVVAWVKAFKLTQGLASEAFGFLKANLDDSEESLIEYLWVRALRNHPAQRSIVSVKMS